MTDYFFEKHFLLCSAFPEYASEMLFLMRAFDGFYQQPINEMRDVLDYIINFAVYSDLTIKRNTVPNLESRIDELIKQGRVLTPYGIEQKYNIKNAKFLLSEYDSALRLETESGVKSYLTRDKESDFLFWAQKQTETLTRCRYDIPLLARKYYTATKNMVLTPIKKTPLPPKSRTLPDVWGISDSEMHEVACKMARKRRVSDPNITLIDMVVKTVRKNMKGK
jgi:hypothetical protein